MKTLRPLALLLLAACPDPGPTGVGLGQGCDATDDCLVGLVCASNATCANAGAPGTSDVDEACATTAHCRLGLACDADGTCAIDGAPGTAAFAEACTVDADCQFDLTCPDGTCRGLQMGLWAGVDCPEPDTGPFRVHVEVPRGEPLADFYRLPFPNDARVGDDHVIDLSGHPSPGVRIEAVGDVVGSLLRFASTDTLGQFGPNQAVFFRLSAWPAPESLSFGLPGDGSLALVDLDGGDPTATHPVGYVVDSAATPYLCGPWLAVYPIDGRPLEPGHRYAALLSTALRDEAGAAAVQDPDLVALLSTTTPSDPGLVRAWEAYRPLRDGLASRSIDPATIAAATVFTVQDVERLPGLVHDAVQAAPEPALDGVVVCGAGDDPYAVEGDPSRGCAPADARWTEVQATVSLPQFQEGRPPFLTLADGGAITATAGVVTPTRFEDVQVSIAVPEGVPMPEAGWPVVLYAHGTGGSATSALRDGFADRFARVSEAGGPEIAYAIVGFDAPLHGPRAHTESWDPARLELDPDAYAPDRLFFNPLNPRAARDVALQQAADAWSLVRLLTALDLDATGSPTGAPLRFDVDHLVYAGHSQGAVTGALFAAFEPEVDAVLLSGAGGLTLRALLDKTSPHPLRPLVRVALADAGLDRVHPVLNLLQGFVDGTDGVNHARRVLRRPPEGKVGKHVLQTYGVGDGFTPDSTQTALVKALGLLQAPQGQPPLDAVTTIALPTAGTNAGGRTGVVVLYPAPAGSDAHFVLFEDDTARAQVATFLATLVTDPAPVVPAP